MTLRRYSKVPILGINKYYGTSRVSAIIREGIKSGAIRYVEDFLKEGQRLDTIAGQYYGKSDLYYIIAAASNIGWALQVPPNTKLIIPNLQDVERLIG